MNVTPSPIVAASKLSQQFSSREVSLTVLNDINVQIFPGQSVAIVGSSGSGKSTLLGLLAGLDLPAAGEVYLAGHCITAMDEEARAKIRGQTVGFVFQNFQLLPSLTAHENVMLPLEVRGVATAAAAAENWLARVGLSARLSHYPKQLSGGEQQRVALARAFVSAPPLLFADEPTGNLDTATGQAIADLLFTLNREQQTTLVLVTHDERLAARCDRQLQISAGRLTERGA